MTATATQTISTREALLILTKDLIVPSASGHDTAEPKDVFRGTRLGGDLAGRPGHMASAVVRDHQDGTVSFSVGAVVPARAKFSTTIMASMVTRENMEEFAAHIAEHVMGVLKTTADA